MTPIETLLDWLGKNHYYIGNDLLEKVEELKVVEKQHIIDTYRKGFMSDDIKLAGDYYNETFKTK